MAAEIDEGWHRLEGEQLAQRIMERRLVDRLDDFITNLENTDGDI